MHSGQHLSKKPGFYFRRTFDLCPPANIECRRYSPSEYEIIIRFRSNAKEWLLKATSSDVGYKSANISEMARYRDMISTSTVSINAMPRRWMTLLRSFQICKLGSRHLLSTACIPIKLCYSYKKPWDSLLAKALRGLSAIAGLPCKFLLLQKRRLKWHRQWQRHFAKLL